VPFGIVVIAGKPGAAELPAADTPAVDADVSPGTEYVGEAPAEDDATLRPYVAPGTEDAETPGVTPYVAAVGADDAAARLYMAVLGVAYDDAPGDAADATLRLYVAPGTEAAPARP